MKSPITRTERFRKPSIVLRGSGTALLNYRSNLRKSGSTIFKAVQQKVRKSIGSARPSVRTQDSIRICLECWCSTDFFGFANSSDPAHYVVSVFDSKDFPDFFRDAYCS